MLGIFSKKSGYLEITREAFEFDFKLPHYRQPESKLPDAAQVWEQLDAVAAEPVHLLVELNHFLHQLNRTHVPSDKRHDLVSRCMEYASPAIQHVFFENQKGKALPEYPPKREALVAAIKCVKEIAISYKRIIKNDYLVGEKVTGKKIKAPSRRVRQCMVGALEMIHAEQRLRALRYQKISHFAWRDCNSIFCILQNTTDVRKPIKPMGLSVSRTSPNESMSRSIKTTAQDIYLSIQLFGLIDPNALSLQQAVVVEGYLKQYLSQIQFNEFTEEQAPVNAVIVSCHRDGPPGLNEDIAAGALVIDINPLLTALSKDYEHLLAQLSGPEAVSGLRHAGENLASAATVKSLDDIERLLALQAMLKKFRDTERADTRKYSDESQEAYVYNGFTAGFRMLSASGLKQLQNQLNIRLAQRSAPLAATGSGEKYTQWEIVNESASGILLRTMETQYIKNLFVGQLIVFATEKRDLSHPSCGWVVRICRDNKDNVEVSLNLLASQIESVVVQTEILKKNAMGMPGIMIFDAGEDLQLIMHQSHRLLRGSTVTIQRGGNSYTYTIGEIGFFQREFVLYRLIH